MAVVVQSLVPADASAVVFTRNPVTHTDDLVITAVRGLGEAMVAGTTTPETIVLDRATREVIDYTPGVADEPSGRRRERRHRRRPRRGGRPGARWRRPRRAREPRPRRRARVRAAVDIEAAIAGGQWFLLQARPITTS